MSSNRLLLLAVAAALLAGCDDDPAGVRENDEVVDCGDDVASVEITVSGGASPVIDWSPRCRVTLLLVEEGAHDIWSLRGDEDANDVEPPVTYGVAPQGLTGAEAEPLRAGHTYEIILWHTGAQSARILTLHEFVR
jgi:hypothetical protein